MTPAACECALAFRSWCPAARQQGCASVVTMRTHNLATAAAVAPTRRTVGYGRARSIGHTSTHHSLANGHRSGLVWPPACRQPTLTRRGLGVAVRTDPRSFRARSRPLQMAQLLGSWLSTRVSSWCFTAMYLVPSSLVSALDARLQTCTAPRFVHTSAAAAVQHSQAAWPRARVQDTHTYTRTCCPAPQPRVHPPPLHCARAHRKRRAVRTASPAACMA